MTELDYFQNTYLFRSSAKVLEVGQDEGRSFLVLDRTIFYPQGGGQPSDQGLIAGEKGSFVVSKTLWTPEGQLRHLGILTGELRVGEEVELQIDEEKRRLHARLHSAGHLLDSAIKACGLNWKPEKGYHYPEGPYVEYEGDFTGDLQVLGEQLRVETQALIDADSETGQEILSKEGSKPHRIVSIVPDTPIPCGGTHVQRSSEVGKIQIRSLKSKSGMVRVAYALEAI